MTVQPLKKVWKKGESILAGIDGFIHGTGNASNPLAGGPTSLRGADDEQQLSIREFMTSDPVTIPLDQPLHRCGHPVKEPFAVDLQPVKHRLCDVINRDFIFS